MCNTQTALRCKIAAYAATTALSVAILVGAVADDDDSVVPVIIWLVAWAVILIALIVAIVRGTKVRKSFALTASSAVMESILPSPIMWCLWIDCFALTHTRLQIA